jgi:hypothetical protein
MRARGPAGRKMSARLASLRPKESEVCVRDGMQARGTRARFGAMSRAQAAVARRLEEDRDGLLLPRGPGYWSTSAAGTGWFTTVQTVRAMEARGWLERVLLHPEERRDPRRLTEAGRAAAKLGTRVPLRPSGAAPK